MNERTNKRKKARHDHCRRRRRHIQSHTSHAHSCDYVSERWGMPPPLRRQQRRLHVYLFCQLNLTATQSVIMTVVSNDAADQSADYDVAIVQQPDRHWCPIETPTACVCLHSSSPNNNKTSKVSDSLMMIFTFIGRKQQPATEWQRQHQQQRRNHLLFSRSEAGNLCFCFDLFNKVFVC